MATTQNDQKKIRYSERNTTLQAANRAYDEKLYQLRGYPALYGYLTIFEVVALYMIYGITPNGDSITEYINDTRAGVCYALNVYYDFPTPEEFDAFIDFVEGV